MDIHKPFERLTTSLCRPIITMERRIPSLTVTDRVAGGLRRRSGGHYTSVQSDDNPAAQSEDDGLSRRSTVLLVQHAQSPTPAATSALFEYHLTHQPGQTQDSPDVSFTRIPLTPRPNPPLRAPTEASMLSTHTRASQIPRLPTPDYENPAEARQARTSTVTSTRRFPGSFRSFLPRGLSFASLRVPPSSFLSQPSTTVSSRPQSMRSKSGESCHSTWSSCTTNSVDSVDSGHSTLIPSIGTTDKFTHKWPKPWSMRGLETRDGNDWHVSRLGGIAAVLEEGRGLGMSSVQRWTTFKWCLLFSVCTVFAYGAAGLVCVIVTWFKSRFPSRA